MDHTYSLPLNTWVCQDQISAANPSLKSGRYYVDYHLRRMRMRHKVSRFKEGSKFVNLPA